MTTTVHIVNLGPNVVEVNVGNEVCRNTTKRLYPHDSTNEYVYDGQDLEISEKKIERKEQ